MARTDENETQIIPQKPPPPGHRAPSEADPPPPSERPTPAAPAPQQASSPRPRQPQRPRHHPERREIPSTPPGPEIIGRRPRYSTDPLMILDTSITAGANRAGRQLIR